MKATRRFHHGATSKTFESGESVPESVAKDVPAAWVSESDDSELEVKVETPAAEKKVTTPKPKTEKAK